MNKSFIAMVVAIPLSLALAGCGGGGGGGGGGGSSHKLKGVAAAGSPIIGQVTVKDSSTPPKTKTVNIAADGGYSVDVSGMTAPYGLRADGHVGGREYHLYSAATSGDVNDTINITPFTDLIIANIANSIAGNYFSGEAYQGLTAEQLNAAETELQAILMPILSAVGLDASLDLLRMSFDADHQGLDGVMDVLQVSVDPDTAVAQIRSIINDATVEIDLEAGLTEGQFTEGDGTAVAEGMTDLQKIAQGFETFRELYDDSYPSEENATLLSLFEEIGFLQDGQELDAFLGEITNNPGLIGIQFTGLRIVELDPDAGTALVAFETVMNGMTLRDAPSLFYMKRVGSSWKMWGNQRIAYFFIEPTAYRYATAPTSIETGMNFNVRDDGGRGIDYAVVKGPGLPAQGVLLVKDISRDEFLVYDEGQAELTDRDFYALTDDAAGAIPDYGAEYSFELYEANDTLGIEDDVLLATYTNALWGRPLGPSELSTSDFPTVTSSPTLTNFNGGNIRINWTIPEETFSDLAYVWISGPQGTADVESEEIDPNDTTTLLNVQFETAEGVAITPVQNKNINVGVMDDLGRMYVTVVFGQ